MSEAVDRVELRRQIRNIIQKYDGPERRLLVNEVAGTENVDADGVDHELDVLEREGFIYLVGDGDDAEVRLP